MVSSPQAQGLNRVDAQLRVMDANHNALPPDYYVLRDSQGFVIQPQINPDGEITLIAVGRKLTIELTPKGLKQRSFELVLEDAPKVFVTLSIDPFTGRVKEISQKPMYPQTHPDGKIRKPGGGQVGLLAPPVNDNCASPSVIFAGATPFNTAEATTDGPANCSGQINRDIWYDYQATATGTLTVSTCNAATFDTKIAIYNGLGCAPGLPIGCNDDFGGCAGFTSQATAPVVVGNHYLIRLGAFGSTTTGTGTLTITAPVGPPANDECAGALPAGCGSTTTFSNLTATTNATDPAYSCRIGGAGQGVGTMWYSFVAAGTDVILDTSLSAVSDTLLGLYSGTCGALVEIACDDDGGTGLRSLINYSGLTPTVTYYIQVSSFSAGSQGSITLDVQCPVGPPPGDNCADAIEIPCGGSATINNATFTTEAGDPAYSCRFGGPGQGIGTAWFRFVATQTSAHVTTAASTAPDTMLAVYSGTCGAFVELACNDDAIGLLSDLCADGLTIGQTYYIQASSFSSFDVGDITVDVECPCPTPPANDDCTSAQALLVPSSTTFDNSLATNDIAVPCGVFSGPFRNVWFVVAGTGTTLTASTCNLGTLVTDTKISVFCADCGAPVCVAGNDDDCPGGGPIFASTVSWCTQVGANYLITVGDFSDFTVPGIIQLDLSDSGSSCTPDVQCLPTGACCLADGSCAQLTGDECTALLGTYHGDGSVCSANVVADPGFEAGQFGGVWTESSTNFGTPICDAGCGFGGGTGPHSGNFWSWFGGIPAFEEGAVSQSVVIPTNASTLDFYLEIPVSSGNGVDFLEANIDGNQVFLVNESEGTGPGYALVQVPLGVYADGAAHTVEFHSIITGNIILGSGFTNFFVDDVAINATVTSCPPPTGACCLADGSCVEVTEEECTAQVGTYHGDGSSCGSVTCPPPTGACCLPSGLCVQLTAADCAAALGTYNGDGSLCGDVNCPQPIDCFTLDFTTDDVGAFMVHGTKVDTEFDGGPNYPVTITSSVNASGANTAAILNSTTGPANQDPDLLVGRGNILILQNDANLNQCPPNSGVYCSHNDDEDGGTLSFAFNVPTSPLRIVLVDIDATDPTSTVVLTDSSARTRTYTVPANRTGDLITNGPPGWGTLDLTVLVNQPGFGSTATVSQMNGFDQTAVVRIDVNLGGSGGVDGLEWCQRH